MRLPARLPDYNTAALKRFFFLVQVEILGMLTALTADITEQAHGIDPWDSSGDTKCKKITTVHFTLFRL